MLHANELIKIGEWVKEHFTDEPKISFAKGFEDIYLIVDLGSTRKAYALSEILKGE